MNHTIVITGESDDLVNIVGDVPGCDEYDTGGSGKATFVVNCEHGAAVHVRVEFTNPGVWAITVAPIDDGHPMPAGTIQGDDGDRGASLTLFGVTNVVKTMS